MKIKKVVTAKVKTVKNIKTVMQNDNACQRNSCLDACTCTGNCE